MFKKVAKWMDRAINNAGEVLWDFTLMQDEKSIMNRVPKKIISPPQPRGPNAPKPQILQAAPSLPPRLEKSKRKQIAQKEEKILEEAAEEPFVDEEKNWNKATDPPAKLPILKPTRKTTNKINALSPERRRFLFMNLKDSSLMDYAAGERAPWSSLFPDQLSVKANRTSKACPCS